MRPSVARRERARARKRSGRARARAPRGGGARRLAASGGGGPPRRLGGEKAGRLETRSITKRRCRVRARVRERRTLEVDERKNRDKQSASATRRRSDASTPSIRCWATRWGLLTAAGVAASAASRGGLADAFGAAERACAKRRRLCGWRRSGAARRAGADVRRFPRRGRGERHRPRARATPSPARPRARTAPSPRRRRRLTHACRRIGRRRAAGPPLRLGAARRALRRRLDSRRPRPENGGDTGVDAAEEPPSPATAAAALSSVEEAVRAAEAAAAATPAVAGTARTATARKRGGTAGIARAPSLERTPSPTTSRRPRRSAATPPRRCHAGDPRDDARVHARARRRARRDAPPRRSTWTRWGRLRIWRCSSAHAQRHALWYARGHAWSFAGLGTNARVFTLEVRARRHETGGQEGSARRRLGAPGERGSAPPPISRRRKTRVGARDSAGLAQARRVLRYGRSGSGRSVPRTRAAILWTPPRRLASSRTGSTRSRNGERVESADDPTTADDGFLQPETREARRLRRVHRECAALETSCANAKTSPRLNTRLYPTRTRDQTAYARKTIATSSSLRRRALLAWVLYLDEATRRGVFCAARHQMRLRLASAAFESWLSTRACAASHAPNAG